MIIKPKSLFINFFIFINDDLFTIEKKFSDAKLERHYKIILQYILKILTALAPPCFNTNSSFWISTSEQMQCSKSLKSVGMVAYIRDIGNSITEDSKIKTSKGDRLISQPIRFSFW